jgi:exopolyphosphatase/guanosine-5'-triphosphate,3'-diphosphate pyrophosphatase
MNNAMHTGARPVAFLDIGTNSIRLLIVRINPNHSTSVLIQLKQTVRLGEGEFDDQVLKPEAIERAVSVSRQFASLIRSYGADDVIAVATAATREAKNQREFVQRLQEAAQLDVRVVSGQEEARLIYLGVSSGFHLEGKRAFFIDISGGSTEVILGTQHHDPCLGSLRLGAIRLSARFPADAHGVVSPGKYNRILRHVQRHAVHTLREMRVHDIDLAVGSSGTIENLADVAARRFAKRRLQRDDVLSAAHLREVVKMLGAMPLKERRRVPGLNPERADIVVAGAAILEAFMQALDLPAIRISARGRREGLLMDYLLRHGHAPALQDLSVRQRSVLELGRTCHFDEAHARTTAQLALSLFDSAGTARLHPFGAWERELLEYAVLLHRIGAFLTYNDYQTHTHCLTRNANLLGFDATEIAIVAATALFHRKAAPQREHPEFAALDRQAQKIVRLLSLLLRLAESLDRSHAGNVRHARFRLKSDTHVVLDIDAAQDCQIELWAVQKHTATFEKVIGYELDVEMMMQREAPDAVGQAE